jgi:salicylate hydroxylase
MASDGISVAIIGGGIGGLAAASSPLRVGIDVHVYEQAKELTEVGAGIQISPNASRILHRLSLAEALADMGVEPLAWHQRRWDDGRTYPAHRGHGGHVRLPSLPNASRRPLAALAHALPAELEATPNFYVR